MKNKYGRPLEDEFRSSQVYRTPVRFRQLCGGQNAEGLGKAAEGMIPPWAAETPRPGGARLLRGTIIPQTLGPDPQAAGPCRGTLSGAAQAGPRAETASTRPRPNPRRTAITITGHAAAAGFVRRSRRGRPRRLPAARLPSAQAAGGSRPRGESRAGAADEAGAPPQCGKILYYRGYGALTR